MREDGAQRRRRASVMAELGPHDDRLGLEVAAGGSPLWPQATKPPLMTPKGLMPKKAGFQVTRSAILPGSSEPTYWSTPKAIAG